MSGVLPLVRENIYIRSPFAFLDDEGKQRAGTSGEQGGDRLSCPGPGGSGG